jgi:hypothetical protein
MVLCRSCDCNCWMLGVLRCSYALPSVDDDALGVPHLISGSLSAFP